MKKTLILQCPGMVCSPPVVSKCLGEAHRRLGVIYITLHYIKSFLFFHTVGNHTVGNFFFFFFFSTKYMYFLVEFSLNHVFIFLFI